MAALPISTDDAESEIKALIKEKGMDVITSKMIRKQLETKFSCSLEDFKAEIDEHIEACICELGLVEKDGKTNDSRSSDKSSDSDDESDSNVHDGFAPSTSSSADAGGRKRKLTAIAITKTTKTEVKEEVNGNDQKRDEEEEVEDMATAIKRRRSAAPAPKRTKKTKGEEEKKKKTNNNRRNSMFTKICFLTPELASLLGTNYMRRAEVVKRMWEYFRSNDLMDPKNKQFVLLNEPLKSLFGDKKKVKAFGMMSHLKKYIKDISMLDVEARAQAEKDVKAILAREEAEENAKREADTKNNSSADEDEDSVSKPNETSQQQDEHQQNGNSSQGTEESEDQNNNGNAEESSESEADDY